MSLREWTKEIEQIEIVFSQLELSDLQKKELVFDIIKNKLSVKPDFKLFPSGNSEASHIRYRTKDGKYSLIVACDDYHSKKWYFYAANDPNIPESYNSLWEAKSYETEEQCVHEAEIWLSKRP